LNNPGDLRDDSIRFNSFSIEEGTVVLPLQLLSFKTVLNGDAVNIYWVTANEINSKSFTVERSTDGINYTAVETTEAAGNSSTETKYQAIDLHPAAGKNFYRLKMIDVNGNFTYSDVSYVFLKALKNDQLFIYPNPVKDRLQIVLTDAGSLFSAAVTNSAGQKVYSCNGTVTTINTDICKNIGKIKPGIYFISLVNDAMNYRGRFLKN
jgi:hypothetical protein